VCTSRPLKGFNSAENPDQLGDAVFTQTAAEHTRCGAPGLMVEGCTLEQAGHEVASNLNRCLTPLREHVQREDWLLGPFTSYGGNDWWHIKWKLETGSPTDSQNIYLGGYGVSFRDNGTGEAIGFPPLHNHHTDCAHECNFRSPSFESGHTSENGLFYFAQEAQDQVKGAAPGQRIREDDVVYYNFLSNNAVFPVWSEGWGGYSTAQDVRGKASSNVPGVRTRHAACAICTQVIMCAMSHGRTGACGQLVCSHLVPQLQPAAGVLRGRARVGASVSLRDESEEPVEKKGGGQSLRDLHS
jgi:hypothetical protein